jgi:hypothetical protein
MKGSSFVALECVIEEQDIRGVLHHFPWQPASDRSCPRPAEIGQKQSQREFSDSGH